MSERSERIRAAANDEVVSDAVRERAPAKLTLSLRVLGTRPDGYHEIEALVVSLADLADDVEVALRGRPEFTLQMVGATEGVPADGSNLAVQAARSLLRRVEPGAGARLRLKKAIPAGAGLGGGSADAAAVLRGVASLLPVETEGIDLEEVGAGLGSDVPVCVRGGLAWMRGRGEVIESVGMPGEFWVVVAVPPFPLATPEVYAAWDAIGGPTSGRRADPPAALAGLVDGLVNDLEPAALEVEPRLEEFRQALEEVSGSSPVLAGSGSAYFVVVPEADAAARIAGAAAPFSVLSVASPSFLTANRAP